MRTTARILLPLALALLLSACQSEEEPLRLPEPVLVKVLADLHIAEAAMQNLRGNTKDSIAVLYYEQIYTIHDVDASDVKHDLESLRQQPQRLKELYTKVMEHTEAMNARSK